MVLTILEAKPLASIINGCEEGTTINDVVI
jgi:hypothetical protein